MKVCKEIEYGTTDLGLRRSLLHFKLVAVDDDKETVFVEVMVGELGMATVEQEMQFAIEAPANVLLNHLSDQVANLVLAHATRSARHTTSTGAPLVTTGDIQSSAHALAQICEEAKAWVEKDERDEDQKRFLVTGLTKLRDTLNSLCAEPGDAN